jgi:hypothetical protein
MNSTFIKPPILFCKELPNETVEKLLFGGILPGQQLLDRPDSRLEDAKTDGFSNQGSVERREHAPTPFTRSGYNP